MRKLQILILGILGLVLSSNSYTQCDRVLVTAEEETPPLTGDWIKVFEDEFEGSELDMVKWYPRIAYPGGEGSGCNDMKDGVVVNIIPQCFLPQNISLSGGVASLIWKKEDPFYCEHHTDTMLIKEYSGAMIWSNPNFLFGKFEAKIWLPNGEGLYPAFWLWTSTNGEIDIMEAKREDKPWMTLHNNEAGKNKCEYHPPSYDYGTSWHIFSAVWDPFYIEFFIDGQSIKKQYKYKDRFNITNIDRDEYEVGKQYQKLLAFPRGDDDQSIILNLGGQDLPNNYTNVDVLLVDWIRAYEKCIVPCRDVSICVMDDLTVEGQTVTIGGGINSFSSGDNVIIRAKEEIIINDGLNIPLGATLDLIIDSNLCP